VQRTGLMTTTREDRRPDWLRRKHAEPGPLDADVRDAFEQLVPQALESAGRYACPTSQA